MSGLAPIGFAFIVSTGVMLPLGVAPTTSDEISNSILLFMAWFTFFLATTQLTLLPIINSTNAMLQKVVEEGREEERRVESSVTVRSPGSQTKIEEVSGEKGTEAEENEAVKYEQTLSPPNRDVTGRNSPCMPSLLFPFSTNSGAQTKSLGSISVNLLKFLPFATLVASLNTLTIALLTFNELPHWIEVWIIQAEIICLTIAVLGKLISKTFTSCYRHYLWVAFLTLCIAFAGIHTYPLFYLPGKIQDNSILHGINCLYHFALVPVAFMMGTILVIISVPQTRDVSMPFVSATFKEGLTVLTFAVGLTTLIIGGSLMIYAVLGNLATASGVGVGEAVRAI